MQTAEYGKYYPVLEKLQEKYLFFLEKTKQLENIEDKRKAVQSLLELAVYHNCGFWTSAFIENFYTDWAQAVSFPLQTGEGGIVSRDNDSFLHVITTGSLTGGHTRVVERWIENAPENQSHSVIFIKPDDSDMSVLEKNTKEKNGKCIYFDNSLSIEEKALKLRELALNFQYIVLHTHMEDPVPVIAFGTEKFTRPVLLYNHASHLFRLGGSIADLVLDIEKNDGITNLKRGEKNTFFLGVPSKEIVYSKPDKNEVRKKLNLPLDKKIIISAGSVQKYNTPGNNHFVKIIEKLINEDTYIYFIGIPKDNEQWKSIEKDCSGHVKLLGYINFNEGYLDYISSADLFVDSYPWGGGTAVIDAVSMGVPAVSLRGIYPQLDYLQETDAYCETPEELLNKAQKILSDTNYAEKIIKQLQNSLEKYQSKDAWARRTKELLEVCPEKHGVKKLIEGSEYNKIDDLSVLSNILTDKNAFNSKSMIKCILKQNFADFVKYGLNYRRKGIPFIFEVLSFKRAGVKTKVIKLFGLIIKT